jgi:hypothetical protein
MPLLLENKTDTQVAPYLTGLINGAGWKTGFPRIISNEDMERLIAESGGVPKLAAIQDVTCDMNVSQAMGSFAPRS